MGFFVSGKCIWVVCVICNGNCWIGIVCYVVVDLVVIVGLKVCSYKVGSSIVVFYLWGLYMEFWMVFMV